MKENVLKHVVWMILAVVLMAFGGAGSMVAQSGSGSYPWEGKTVVVVGDADRLRDALIDDGNGGKVFKIDGTIDVHADIESSINASIDLNGHTINLDEANISIKVTNGCLNIYDSSANGDGSIGVNYAGKGFVVGSEGTLKLRLQVLYSTSPTVAGVGALKTRDLLAMRFITTFPT